MGRATTVNLKQRLIAVHRWLALVGLLFLLVQFATGMVLVYRWQLVQWLDPAGMTAGAMSTPESTQVSPGQVVAALEQRWPQASVERLYAPQLPGGTYFAALAMADSAAAATAHAPEFVSVDPGSGEVLRSGTLWRFPVEVALRLHFQPLPGKVGYLVPLFTSSVLLALMTTGIWFWWPRRGRLRQSLAINGKAPPRLRLRQLHRTLGICLAPLALVVAVTGLVMVVEMLAAPAGARQSDRAAQRPLGSAQIDAAIALASEEFPGSVLRDIRLVGQRLKVQFHAPERNPRAVHQVWVDGHSQTIDSVVPAGEDPGLWVVLLPIHSGDILAWPGKLLLMLVATGLLLLTALGSYLWLIRWRSLTKPN